MKILLRTIALSGVVLLALAPASEAKRKRVRTVVGTKAVTRRTVSAVAVAVVPVTPRKKVEIATKVPVLCTDVRLACVLASSMAGGVLNATIAGAFPKLTISYTSPTGKPVVEVLPTNNGKVTLRIDGVGSTVILPMAIRGCTESSVCEAGRTFSFPLNGIGGRSN